MKKNITGTGWRASTANKLDKAIGHLYVIRQDHYYALSYVYSQSSAKYLWKLLSKNDTIIQIQKIDAYYNGFTDNHLFVTSQGIVIIPDNDVHLFEDITLK